MAWCIEQRIGIADIARKFSFSSYLSTDNDCIRVITLPIQLIKNQYESNISLSNVNLILYDLRLCHCYLIVNFINIFNYALENNLRSQIIVSQMIKDSLRNEFINYTER